jgi:alpha-L-fucosidase
MDVPWESCITLNECWSFQYDQDKVAKSPREVIHLLIGIVAKGGNLALNVSPQPDGELSCGTLQVLNELGAWLKLNGEGIYGTRPVYPWSHRNICYTKKGSNIYAFILYRRDYQTFRAAELQVEGTVKDVILLRTGESVPFTQHGDKVLVNTCDLPLYDMKYADCLKVVLG